MQRKQLAAEPKNKEKNKDFSEIKQQVAAGFNGKLSKDIDKHILGFCDAIDLAIMSGVSKSWYHTASTPELWLKLKVHYPLSDVARMQTYTIDLSRSFDTGYSFEQRKVYLTSKQHCEIYFSIEERAARYSIELANDPNSVISIARATMATVFGLTYPIPDGRVYPQEIAAQFIEPESVKTFLLEHKSQIERVGFFAGKCLAPLVHLKNKAANGLEKLGKEYKELICHYPPKTPR